MREEKEQTTVEEQSATEAEQASPPTEPSPEELLQQQVAELENRLLRLHADFDNYRRRTLREREESGSQAEAAIVRGLLPVLDNFDRALAALPEGGEAAWVDGVRLVQRQLLDVLTQQGLQPIASLEQIFDPNLHEAVMRDESGDTPDGTILQELQRGYQFKGKLLRPSMVKVASQP